MLSLPLAFSGGRFFQGSGEFPWEGKSAWHGQGSIQDILLFFFILHTETEVAPYWFSDSIRTDFNLLDPIPGKEQKKKKKECAP